MYNNSIARNIITKAVLPFVITLLLFSVFSCKKEAEKQVKKTHEVLIYTGTYLECVSAPSGGLYHKGKSIEVRVAVLSQTEYILDYLNGQHVVVNDSAYFDNDTIYGMLTNDSLIIFNKQAISSWNTCYESFRGVK